MLPKATCWRVPDPILALTRSGVRTLALSLIGAGWEPMMSPHISPNPTLEDRNESSMKAYSPAWDRNQRGPLGQVQAAISDPGPPLRAEPNAGYVAGVLKTIDASVHPDWSRGGLGFAF